jgi:hypothetical protein
MAAEPMFSSVLLDVVRERMVGVSADFLTNKMHDPPVTFVSMQKLAGAPRLFKRLMQHGMLALHGKSCRKKI